jgi:hypothetical protein
VPIIRYQRTTNAISYKGNKSGKYLLRVAFWVDIKMGTHG